jgi:tetraacyldisaccharide 4'-kinase
MREPAFWWREAGAMAALLSPLSALYGAVAASRMAGSGTRTAIPVICVGNFTLGGSGKTPTAIALARMLTAAGQKPALLSRGYGGQNPGPVEVDFQHHNASEVGDEALLLSRGALTIVARDRVAGANAATAAGANVIVMDDGLQNPSLVKDLAIAVVDGRRGAGNGKVFPAGPLRAPMPAQWAQTGALLVIGEPSGVTPLVADAKSRGVPVFHGTLEPDRAAITSLQGRKVLAFAGIGDPDKFFATLDAAGIAAPIRETFPDHHRYSNEQAAALVMQAEHKGLELVTTEKDFVRLAGEPGLAALHSRAHVLPVTLRVTDQAGLRDLVMAKLGR